MREEDDESRLVLNLPKMGAYLPMYRSDSEAPPPLVGCPGDSAQLDIWDSNGLVLFHHLSAHRHGSCLLLVITIFSEHVATQGGFGGELAAVLLQAFFHRSEPWNAQITLSLITVNLGQ